MKRKKKTTINFWVKYIFCPSNFSKFWN